MAALLQSDVVMPIPSVACGVNELEFSKAVANNDSLQNTDNKKSGLAGA